MVTRFIYPKMDMFFKNRGMLDEARQLHIASVVDDGKYWFGVREAIENYCAEEGCEIANVCWLVKVNPDDYDYAEIIAKDIDEWESKFNVLGVQYDIIPEEKW